MRSPSFCIAQLLIARQYLRAAELNAASIAAPSSAVRVNGFAYFSSGRHARVATNTWKRVAISENITPQAKCLTCTILAPNPSKAEPLELIKCLPKLLFPFHRSLRNLTFFITPDFLPWFNEKDDFMQKALAHMHQEWSASIDSISAAYEGYRHVIQSRVAVVDRIPFPDGNSSGCAGISAAITPWSGRWLRESDLPVGFSSSAKGSPAVPQLSLKVPFTHKKGEMKHMRILLQPANTIFLNGLQSTMFVESWVLDDKVESGPTFSRDTAREHVNRFSMNHLAEASTLTVPLKRLTETREISMCMGNIISKLVSKSEAESMSASLELEEKVSAFMRSNDATGGTLSVYALIIPKASDHKRYEEGPVVPTEFLGYHKSVESTDTTDEKQGVLDSIRLAISKGAHLHKVTSGGGGWGKKQGLLSLEPAFDHQGSGFSSTQAFEDVKDRLDKGEPIWGQHTPEIARPGDLVEFYGFFLSNKEEEALIRKESLRTALKVSDLQQWSAQEWAKQEVSSVVWGVIPPQDSNSASSFSPFGNNLVAVPNHFGMLSEKGMVLQRLDRGSDKRALGQSAATSVRMSSISRIDVPHTSLTYSIPTRAAARKDSKKKKPEQDAPTFTRVRYTLGQTDVTSREEARVRRAKKAQMPRPGRKGIGRVFKYIANSSAKLT
ncbi:hypothetical protein EPUS_02596 [Endocarpon pusillum Z07020]|uniref:Uncharacterized protein n=1 Tax=Endocarpon pusillum (strain Z07020 / HMAS-L-300199) TaxID=1263415 RepID=U1I0X7_ENDPU|nr:uncharacterized protein EPUS_02596 [Endocarpon pusillum Z07020]ERF76885.1 hypothetical protein EPUS_02596 [Endocarpon pusillum Z07020]